MSNSEMSPQSAAARRVVEAELRLLVDKFAPAHKRLIGAIRKCLRTRLPTAYEVVYEYRNWFVISYSPTAHGYDGVFAIRGSTDGVKLYFTHGKELPDPGKLLRGSGTVSRSINVESASTLSRPEVMCLMDAAIDYHKVPFPPSSLGPTMILSPSAKQSRKGRSD